jgi:hypothetical protein
MGEEEKLVAVISPWEKLSDLIKRKFRLESLPSERKVMVWRDDLQTKEDLEAELTQVGITSVEVRSSRVIGKWQDVQ